MHNPIAGMTVKSLEMTLRYNNVRTERLRMLLLKRYPVWGKENCPSAACLAGMQDI